MSSSSIFRLYGYLMFICMLAGTWGCKNRKHSTVVQDVQVVDVQDDSTQPPPPGKSPMIPKEMTLPDGTRVLMDPRTVIRTAEGFGQRNREIQFDGEAMFVVRGDAKRPFIIHTRNLVIQVLGTRLHVDAFASSPGEEVDLLEGKLRVVKSYHSSTDNEPETLQAGEMVMINRDIDLMEKEKLNPEEQKALQVKFPLTDTTAPRN